MGIAWDARWKAMAGRGTALQRPAHPSLLLKSADAGYAAAFAAGATRAACRAAGRLLHGRIQVATVVKDNRVDGPLEDLVDARHLFAAAFHVLCVHLLGDGHALAFRHGRQALRLEHLHTRFLVPQI